MLPYTIEKLCAIGCNLIINYQDYLPASLEKFAAIISRTNGIITIKNCSNALPASLEKIASLGKEHVKFDFTE